MANNANVQLIEIKHVSRLLYLGYYRPFQKIMLYKSMTREDTQEEKLYTRREKTGYKYKPTCACVCVCIYLSIYISIYLYVLVCIYILIYRHIHIFIIQKYLSYI